MKAKIVKESLNTDEHDHEFDLDKDYYPEATEIVNEMTNDLEAYISSLKLKKDIEFNVYVRLEQWAANKGREVDGSYWTSGQPG